MEQVTSIQKASSERNQAIDLVKESLLSKDKSIKSEHKQRVEHLQESIRNLEEAVNALPREIENIVREEFGFRKSEDRWISETMLYQVIIKMFPNHEVNRHHRPVWLEGLELDIYVPKLKLGFEYQGQQHFYPVDIWGGEEALLALQNRDARKAKLCQRYGIQLIAIDYTEPLTTEYIRSRIEDD